MSPQHHHSPSPLRYQVTQGAVAFGLAVTLLAIPLQIVLAVLTQGWLFLLTAFMLLLLGAPLMMFLRATPPVSVYPDGLEIRPLIGRTHKILWSDIEAVKRYPLLPMPDQEVERRTLQGRKRYTPAEGVMLIVPTLHWSYRFTGYFAGEGFRPVVAFTNRAHTHYDSLLKSIKKERG